MTTHLYDAAVAWSGSTAGGYRGYSRGHTGSAAPSPATLELSADPAFGGDPAQLNPEQLLVLAAASCQLLSFLALAARERIEVVHYEDDARGLMSDPRPDGSPMHIERIDLSPRITVTPGTEVDRILALVERAHESCYIANSLVSQVAVRAAVEVRR
jgi:organic hydroperoxide reductase OsmC/OhrA